jgi:hypothetical protein
VTQSMAMKETSRKRKKELVEGGFKAAKKLSRDLIANVVSQFGSGAPAAVSSSVVDRSDRKEDERDRSHSDIGSGSEADPGTARKSDDEPVYYSDSDSSSAVDEEVPPNGPSWDFDEEVSTVGGLDVCAFALGFVMCLNFT